MWTIGEEDSMNISETFCYVWKFDLVTSIY